MLAEQVRPLYQTIAEEAVTLSRLGLTNVKIARHLGVDDKTVAKAMRWAARGDT